MKPYLNALDPRLLRRRIGWFWELDFTRLSDLEVSHAIESVLMVGGRFVIPACMRTIPPGTQLLRVRHVPAGFVPTPKDCWAPPSEAAAGNRLNRPSDPWLYTSFDLGTVFSEMPLPSGKIAMVMIYSVAEELRCSYPGFDFDIGFSLSKREENRLALATQFLRDLLSLEVNEGDEHLYKITQSLVADLVDYPDCVGVWYPGAKSHGHHVAVKGAHQRRLRLSSVKMVDSVAVHYSTENDRWQVTFRLLRSYDENLAENTRAGAMPPNAERRE